MTRHLLRLALFAAVVASQSVAAQATILPFVITPTPTANSLFETTFADYGDNVNSTSVISGLNTYSYLQGNAFTPNLALTYSHTVGGGNLGPVTYALGPWAGGVCYLYAFTGSRHFITFTPTNNAGVQLNSFVFDLYDGPYPVNEITWTVHKDTTVGPVLLSANETGWATGENRLINLGGVQYKGTVVLEFFLKDVVGGGNVAIDNLNFDEFFPVPEPSTASLLGLGLCGLAVRARRRRSAA